MQKTFFLNRRLRVVQFIMQFIFHQQNAITFLITRIIGIQDFFPLILSSNGVVHLDQLSGAWYCISRPAIGCLSYTHILSRYWDQYQPPPRPPIWARVLGECWVIIEWWLSLEVLTDTCWQHNMFYLFFEMKMTVKCVLDLVEDLKCFVVWAAMLICNLATTDHQNYQNKTILCSQLTNLTESERWIGKQRKRDSNQR